MFKKITQIAFLMLIMVSLIKAEDKDNSVQLLQLSTKNSIQWIINQREAINYANKYNFPFKQETADNGFASLQMVRNGIPFYISTCNVKAAKTISTDKLWPGGLSALNLTGSTETLGVWDAGRVRTTHVEFTNRVTQSDNAPNLHSHSTHVAGTMIGAGINANAKGMSYQGRLLAYDWDDDAAEMAAAAAGGLRVSNHSYGFITGWYYNFLGDGRWVWFGDVRGGNSIDAYYGYYDEVSKQYDEVSVNAPYYLICFAAGNDRGKGPGTQPVQHWVYSPFTDKWELSNATREVSGGVSGYDCISHQSLSKNILTVGAVNPILSGWTKPSDVVMSSFSSWGPTDDGRIKPDVVANGVSLFSTVSNADNAYGNSSGTSMATPNTSGSIGLLLQLHRQIYGSDQVRSATMKALLIQTADEAGPANGPDYSNGWGLANSYSAAKLIQENSAYNEGFNISEQTLRNGEVIELKLYTKPGQQIKTTVAWIDPVPQQRAFMLNNRLPMIVDDIDLRVVDNQTTYLPWILNPEIPSSAAITGDNFRDNIEQVIVNSPQSNMVTIRISHKGSLTGTSDYSYTDFDKSTGSSEGEIIENGDMKDEISLAEGKNTHQIISLVFQGLYNLIEPTLAYPTCSGAGVSVNPNLSWNILERADYYNIQVSSKSDFSTIDFDLKNIVDNNVNISNLKFQSKYYWRVQAGNTIGEGPWSAACDFTTTPIKPVLLDKTKSQVVCENSNANLSATVDGTVIQYQWQRDGIDLSGQTSQILQLTNVKYSQSGAYTCKITNRPGSDVIYTSPAILYVCTNTEITQQPKDQSSKTGNVAFFELLAHVNGAPADYKVSVQWYRGTEKLADNSKISGSQTSILTIKNIDASDIRKDYWAEVIGLCDKAQTEKASIINSDIITKQPESVNICQNTDANFSVTASSTGNTLTYNWMKNGILLTEGNKYKGTKTANLIVSNVQVSDIGMYNADIYINNDIKVETTYATLEVKESPAVSSFEPKGNISLEAGSKLTMTVIASGFEPLSYEWAKDNVKLTNNSNVLTIEAVTGTDAGEYSVIISNACGETSVKSGYVTITKKTEISTGVEDNNILSTVNISPNPTSHLSRIEFNLDKDADVEISVNDLIGNKLVSLSNDFYVRGQHNLEFNSRDLSSGTYLLTFKIGDYTYTQLLMIIK